MSTSYSAYILPSKEHKDKIIKALKNEDILNAIELANEVEHIKIGGRTYGWKFAWNPFNPYIRSLTKEAVVQFISRPEVRVYDEYRTLQDKAEFLEMAFSWDGWDSNAYAAKYPEEHRFSLRDAQAKTKEILKKDIKFTSPTQSDFESDGLRWSILNDYRWDIELD